jgi:acetyl esterase/lipase
MRVRIYRPDLADGHAVITYFHGSAFVICSVDTHDVLCRHLCLKTRAVVVSVDYGLAPEAPFPAGPDDSFAATRWVAKNATSIGGDPARLIVAGDSAGATMAIVTALRARDEGGPAIAAQFLMYPVTNYPDPPTISYSLRGEGFGLTEAVMRRGWDLYVTNPEDRAHPHPCAKRAATPGYDSHPQVQIGIETVQRVSDSERHRVRDRIALLRAVDRDHKDRAVLFDLNRPVHYLVNPGCCGLGRAFFAKAVFAKVSRFGHGPEVDNPERVVDDHTSFGILIVGFDAGISPHHPCVGLIDLNVVGIMDFFSYVDLRGAFGQHLVDERHHIMRLPLEHSD